MPRLPAQLHEVVRERGHDVGRREQGHGQGDGEHAQHERRERAPLRGAGLPDRRRALVRMEAAIHVPAHRTRQAARQHLRVRGQLGDQLGRRADHHPVDRPHRDGSLGQADHGVHVVGSHRRHQLAQRLPGGRGIPDGRAAVLSVLPEHAVLQHDPAGPRLRVDHEDPSRPDHHVVDVREPTARPRRTVDHRPRRKQCHQRGGRGLLCVRARVPVPCHEPSKASWRDRTPRLSPPGPAPVR